METAARNDASIEEMQKDTAAAAGLDEVAEAGNGTASEESKSLAASPPSPAPAEGENGTDALAAQADPAEQSAAEPQVEAKQAAAMDGAEAAAPAQGPVRLSEQERIDQRNNAYATEGRRHVEQIERAKQMERDDHMDYDQAAWFEARGGAQRTAPGVGCGYFDSDHTGTEHQAVRWGRNYRDVDPQGQKRWTAEAENL